MQGFLEVLNNFLLRIQSEEVLKCILVVQILVFLFLIGDLWMKLFYVGILFIFNFQKSSYILLRSVVLVKLIDMLYQNVYCVVMIIFKVLKN